MIIMDDGTQFETLEDAVEAQSKDLAKIHLRHEAIVHQMEILNRQVEKFANIMRSLAVELTEVAGTFTSSAPNISSPNRTRFDIGETSLPCVNQVSLESEADDVFDEMPHPVPEFVIETQHDSLVSNEENRECTVDINEDQKVLLVHNEEQCNSTMQLKRDVTTNVQIYGLLEDRIYLVVREAHHSLFESKYANEIEIMYINHGNISFEKYKCLLRAFDNAEILESHVFNIVNTSNECGMGYAYRIGSMFLVYRFHGTLFMTHSSFDEDVIFLFDPGGHGNLGGKHVVVLVKLISLLATLVRNIGLFEGQWSLYSNQSLLAEHVRTLVKEIRLDVSEVVKTFYNLISSSATLYMEEESEEARSVLNNVGWSMKSGALGIPYALIHTVAVKRGHLQDQLWQAFYAHEMVLLLISSIGALIEDGASKGLGLNEGVQLSMESRTEFCSVAGVDGAKSKLQEIVHYFRGPTSFYRHGGKFRKGVLRIGSPGFWKFMLARAKAGEVIQFFSCCGSECEDLFVGVGACIIRNLFATAMKQSPCLIFVEKIGDIGGYIPKDQQYMKMRLNQLLVEWDRFKQNEGTNVIGTKILFKASPNDSEGWSQILESQMTKLTSEPSFPSLEHIVIYWDLNILRTHCQCLDKVYISDCEVISNTICKDFSHDGACPMVKLVILLYCKSLTTVDVVNSLLMNPSVSCHPIILLVLKCLFIEEILLYGCGYLERGSLGPAAFGSLIMGLCLKLNTLAIEAPKMASVDYQQFTSLDAFFCSQLKHVCLFAAVLLCLGIQSLVSASLVSTGSVGLGLKLLHGVGSLGFSYSTRRQPAIEEFFARCTIHFNNWNMLVTQPELCVQQLIYQLRSVEVISDSLSLDELEQLQQWAGDVYIVGFGVIWMWQSMKKITICLSCNFKSKYSSNVSTETASRQNYMVDVYIEIHGLWERLAVTCHSCN